MKLNPYNYNSTKKTNIENKNMMKKQVVVNSKQPIVNSAKKFTSLKKVKTNTQKIEIYSKNDKGEIKKFSEKDLKSP